MLADQEYIALVGFCDPPSIRSSVLHIARHRRVRRNCLALVRVGLYRGIVEFLTAVMVFRPYGDRTTSIAVNHEAHLDKKTSQHRKCRFVDAQVCYTRRAIVRKE